MITKYPNKILYTVSEDVSLEEGLKIAELLLQEIKNLSYGNCVGLAAPQIGLNKNVFIALGIMYINPKITGYSAVKYTDMEGCYSLEKDVTYKVQRSDLIRMEWMNKKGEKKIATFSGFQAQVLQHEYDHLQGRLCCGENTPKEDEK